MAEEDELFYDEDELKGPEVEDLMGMENILKKFRNTFGDGDGLFIFEYIIDHICHTFDIDIATDKEAAWKEVGLNLWDMAIKADVEICNTVMRNMSLRYQNEKVRILNQMKGDQT